MAKAFSNEPLADMVGVGTIEPQSAVVWLRSAAPGNARVEWWPDDERGRMGTVLVEVRDDDGSDHTARVKLQGSAVNPPLRPNQAYRYRVVHDGNGHLIGEGKFATAPANSNGTPERFSIAIMSCHQPFHGDGTVKAEAADMLRAAKKCLDRHDTRLVYLVGDQGYSDLPCDRSLFDPDYFKSVAPPGRSSIHDCTLAEVRALYHDRYRHFWNRPDWQALQAEYPCYPILDDHDIIDNWGSHVDHEEPRWQTVGQGARSAFFDYQGSRLFPEATGLPDSFHRVSAFGNTATFIMDLRSNRRVGDNGGLVSQAQRDDFEQFLQDHTDARVLLIVVSVPAVHLPESMARLVSKLPPRGEDFSGDLTHAARCWRCCRKFDTVGLKILSERAESNHGGDFAVSHPRLLERPGARRHCRQTRGCRGHMG